jgi:hypothetical protein
MSQSLDSFFWLSRNNCVLIINTTTTHHVQVQSTQVLSDGPLDDMALPTCLHRYNSSHIAGSNGPLVSFILEDWLFKFSLNQHTVLFIFS